MGTEDSKSLDLLGIKPVGEALNTLTVAGTKGAGAFLSRICLPAAEELGLLLQDKVRVWRAKNANAVLAKAEHMLAADAIESEVHAPPRLVGVVLDQGSWIETEDVQKMWAGLLASACTSSGDDDSNLMFTDILSRLSRSQVRILACACENATKEVYSNGLIGASNFQLSLSDLHATAQINDLHQLDRELDHLRSLGLIHPIQGGFTQMSTTADLTPTALALQMYVRSNGTRRDPIVFFGLKSPSDKTMAGPTSEPSVDFPE